MIAKGTILAIAAQTQQNAFALCARRAMHDSDYEERPGYCLRFLRQVVQTLTDRYDDHWRGSTKATTEEFRQSKIGCKPEDLSDYPRPGDLLFKEYGSGDKGHCGIVVGRLGSATEPLVAENASIHSGEDGAKGYRTISEFGRVTWVVRQGA